MVVSSKKNMIIGIIAFVIVVVGLALVFFVWKGGKKEPSKVITYTGTKEITVNENAYKVGYVYKDIDTNDVMLSKLELYLNDERVTSVDLYTKYKDTTYTESYDVKLHNFAKDYILVEVISKLDSKDTDSYEGANIVVLSTKGKILEKYTWSSKDSIRLVSTMEKLTYEIHSDYLIFYEKDNNTVNKYKYTINQNQMSKELVKTYTIDKDVIVNGK